MVAHAQLLLPIELLKNLFFCNLYDMGKLRSKSGEDWSINNITILSTDAGRTRDARHVNVILYSVQSIGQTIKIKTVQRAT